MIKDKEPERRLPRLGKLKLGIKDEKGYPKSIDYFRADGKFEDEFHTVYGHKPDKIKVIFPWDDVEQNMNEYYRCYKTGGLFCIGDGETARRADETGQLAVSKECTCELLESEDCKPVMLLNVIVMGLSVTGVWTISSSSRNIRSNIRSAMELTKNLSGKIMGVPFWLTVRKEKSSIAGNIHVYPVVYATPVAGIEQLLSVDKSKELSAGETFLALSGQVENEEDKSEENEKPQESKPHEPLEDVLGLDKGETEELNEPPPDLPDEELSTQADSEPPASEEKGQATVVLEEMTESQLRTMLTSIQGTAILPKDFLAIKHDLFGDLGMIELAKEDLIKLALAVKKFKESK